MQSAKLSIIIPIYNMQEYIVKAVQSVFDQDYKNFELILIDDGSVDNSLNICREIAKNNNKVVVIHQENKGLLATREVGVKAATGDYIAFLDPDDWVSKSFWNEMMKKIVSEDCDIVVGGYKKVYKTQTMCPFKKNEERIFLKDEALIAMFEFNYYKWELCDKIYKSSILKDINLDIKISVGEDLYRNWYAFNRAKKICFIPLFGYFYLQREGSMSKGGEIGEYKQTVNCVFDKISQNMKMVNADVSRVFELRRLCYYVNYALLSAIKGSEIQYYKERKRRYMNNLKSYITSGFFSCKELMAFAVFCLPLPVTRRIMFFYLRYFNRK